ncbi:MAG: hypothetical protein EP329_26845 [Deltaproteobacteria bacterium]|nr:MAG: hypothetical protein EP329_26845 [Deltaproteobacteria bacterium]
MIDDTTAPLLLPYLDETAPDAPPASFYDTWRTPILALLEDDPHLAGQELCDVTTYAVDRIVIDACERALRAAPPPGEPIGPLRLPERWAVTALGGYGRNQMCLRSDVDVQLVIPDDAGDPTPFMEAFVGHLTAARFKVGHGVRTVTESVMLAQAEPSFATAVLTSRHVLGDRAITEAVRGPVYRHLAGAGLAGLVDALEADRARRARRLGDTVFVLEPDLKSGIGGLRDAHVSGWLALVTGQPYDRRVLFAEDFLLKVRMALHAVATFKCDRLAFEYQDAVADALQLRAMAGQPPAIELMRQVHRAMRVIAGRAHRQLEYARDRVDYASRVPVPDWPGLVRIRDRLARADGGPPRSTAEVVDATRAVVATGIPLDASLEDGFEAIAGHLGAVAPEDPQLNALLLGLLTDTRAGATTALRLMHRTGLLTAIVPEFDGVIGRIQRDLYHVYTVDEHILRAVDKLKLLARGELADLYPRAAECLTGLRSLRPLAVALLLHDIGKGYGPRHHERGAKLADVIAPRLGLTPEEVETTRVLIRHQADMALICMRRDLGDPRPIRSLARAVGDVETLDALHVLTVCDWSSVGPDTFNSWNRTLLRSLYERTRELLERPNLFTDTSGIIDARRRELMRAELGEEPEVPGNDSDPIDDFMSALPTRYFNTVPAARVRDHYHLWRRYREHSGTVVHVYHPDGTAVAEVAVVCPDQPGLLARLTGGLATARLGVVAAEIYSLDDGGVLDLFRVHDPRSRLTTPRQAEQLREALVLAAQSETPTFTPTPSSMPTAAEALPPLPTSVTCSNEAATEHTVIDVVTTDRDGLLFDLASFFHDHGISVELAFVTTMGRKARDSFYVVDTHRSKLNAAAVEAVVTGLTRRLAP